MNLKKKEHQMQIIHDAESEDFLIDFFVKSKISAILKEVVWKHSSKCYFCLS